MTKQFLDFSVSKQVDEVLILCKSHLDIGFTNFASEVKHAYLNEFIPKAIALGMQLRQEKAVEQFTWNVGSWLLYEYWHSVSGERLRQFEAAVAAGIVAWHALPFTTHTELFDPSLFESGLLMARELDTHFGRKTIAAKMTDVPGHTGALVSILARNQVKFLHIGVNPASKAPEVPSICRWRRDGDEILLMYAAGDYGQNVLLPELRKAVIWAHGGDNSAPMSLGGVRAAFRQAQLEYPNAMVRMGSLNDLAHWLTPHAAEYPLFTGEIGDSWIHGLGSDPGKVAAFRALSRARRQLLTGRGLDCAEALAPFERNLLLVGEHTWGLDIKTHLGNDSLWTPDELEFGRRMLPNFGKVERSWQEQRDYLIQAKNALPREYRPFVHKELRALRATPARLKAPQSLPPVLETRHFRAGFNRRGELATLSDRASGCNWGRAGSSWMSWHYRQYPRSEVERYMREYCRIPDGNVAVWALCDMGKYGLPATLPACRTRGERAEFEVLRRRDGVTVKSRIFPPSEALQATGCPERVEIVWHFPDAVPEILVTVQWFGKRASRAPEGIYLSFATCFGAEDAWRMNKMGARVDPMEVVRGGNRAMHALQDQESLTITGAAGSLRLDSLDAPLFLPGRCELWRFRDTLPDLERGFHFCLYNNQWGTNFPMWYSDDAIFRFQIALNAANAAENEDKKSFGSF